MTANDDGRSDGEKAPFDVGSVADEATKLLEALQGWANNSGAGPAGAATLGFAERLRSLDDHVGHGDACLLCPLCRVINAVRRTDPEVREHMASALGSLSQAASAYLRQQREASRDDSSPTRIDLDD